MNFLGAVADGAAAKTGEVVIGGMGTDLYSVLRCQSHGFLHDRRVPGVKAAGDVGHIDKGHHLIVLAHTPGTVAFPQVTIQFHLTAPGPGTGPVSVPPRA